MLTHNSLGEERRRGVRGREGLKEPERKRWKERETTISSIKRKNRFHNLAVRTATVIEASLRRSTIIIKSHVCVEYFNVPQKCSQQLFIRGTYVEPTNM